MTTPVMSFVRVKAPAQPPAIPRVCVIRSVWVHVWARRRKAWPTQVWIWLPTWLLSWRVWRGREGPGLMEGHGWEEETGRQGGRVGRGKEGRGGDLWRKGKCGSTQSKPCHMFQSAGIWPPVQTRMLCKRLLIRESACRKTECQSGAEASCWCVCRNTVTWCHSMESRDVRVLPEHTLIQWVRVFELKFNKRFGRY